jgi:trimeric autotransporter adhesin
LPIYIKYFYYILKKRILYIILGVMLLSVKGMGQVVSFSGATNNFEYNGGQQTPFPTEAKGCFYTKIEYTFTGVSYGPIIDIPPTSPGSYTVNAKLIGTGCGGVTSGDFSFTITKKDITGSFTADNKQYDGNNSATVLTRSPGAIVGGETVTLTGGTATFNDASVGNGKTVTLVGAALSGANAGNYNLLSVSTTAANITKKDITGSFTADNKQYDGNNSATVLTRSPGAIVGGETVTLTGGTATFNDASVGNGKTVTLVGAALSGANAGNYNLLSVSTTAANITKKDITGSFTADNKQYDGNNSATVLTRSPGAIVGGETVTLTGGTATFNDASVGNGKTVTLVGAALSGANAGNYNLLSVSTTAANITKKDITGSFTADNKQYDGNNSATVLTRSPGAIVGGETVTLTGGTATFNDASVGNGKTVTLVGAALSGANAGNYNLLSVSTTAANITKKDITGSFTADNKQYDGNNSATVLTRSPGAIVGGETVTLTGGTATFNDASVGNGKTVTLVGAALSGANAGNYNLLSVSTTAANITKKDITGSFTADNKQYDGNNSATVLTRSPGAIVGGETVTLTGGTATFNDASVGNGKTVTLVGAALSGANAGNYNLLSVSTTAANITKKDITGSFTADNKQYDGNNSATVLTRSPGAIVGGETVTLTGGTAAFNDASVGNGKTVTLVGAALSGANAGNYNLLSVSTTAANITKKDITGSFTADNKQYDGNNSATVLTRSPGAIVGGETVTLTGGTATFNDASVGNGKTVTLVGAALSGANAGNYNLLSVSTTAANITKKDITGSFTADNKQYDGNNSATVLTRSPGAIVGGETVTLTGGTAAFNDASVGNGKTVTLVGAALSGANAGNYNLLSVSTTTANITKKDITGSFTADNKQYDGNNSATVLTRSPGAIVGGETVTLTGGTATFNDASVGNGKTVTLVGAALSGANAGNYNLLSVSTTAANITKKDITITVVPNQTKEYGAANPATYTYGVSPSLTGLVALNGTLTRAAGETVGPWAIQQNDLTTANNPNYTISYVGDNFTITKKPITVTVVPNQTKEYGAANPATYTYGVSPSLTGLVALNGTLTRAAGETVGPWAIEQNDLTTANNPNYTISYVGDNFTITKKPITVTVVPNQTKEYGAANPATYTYGVSPSLTGLVALNGTLTRAAGETVGPWAIQQNDLTTANNPNYTISYVGDNFTITKKPITVTVVPNQTKEYGAANPATYTYGVSPSLTGLVALNGTLTRAAGETVGPWAIQQNDLTTANNPNYTISYVGNNFTITKKLLTVTATPGQTKVYGTADPSIYQYTLSAPLLTGDVLTGALSRVAGENVGPFAINQGTLTNANYDITYVGSNFTITTAPLSITGITGANKIYDGTTNATINGTASYVGLVSADAGFPIAGTPSFNFDNKNKGTAKPITVSGFTAPSANYTLTQPTGLTGDITPKTAIINIAANNKPFDGTTTATVIPSSPNFISTDIVIINYTSATFDTKDVGNNKTVTVTGISLAGADAQNYVLSSTTATAVANITGSPIPFVVPNAFTPNGDLLNDEFKIIFNNTTGVTLNLQIFNRNGKLMFSTTNLTQGWDGRYNSVVQDMGVYFVKYRIQIAGGATYEDTPRIYLLK